MRTPLLLLAVGLLVTGCGADRASPSPASAPPPSASPTAASPGVASPGMAPPGVAGDRLEVAYDAGDGTAPQAWTLTCAPPGGSHPDPAGACSDLAAATDPFAAPDPDAVCTEVYGGPQTARVTGTWAAQPVDTDFDRVNGCAIARWEGVGRLLPAPPDTALEPPA